MWKSSVFNSSDSIGEYTLGARAVLDPRYIQAEVQGKKLPPCVQLEHLLSCLHLVQRTEGRVEDRVQQPALQFPFSFASLLFSARCPNCAEPCEKNNLQRLLFSEISHRRKELRLSNLIRLGLLCLNPWSKVFNQLWGDRGRRLCVGSPGRGRVGEGQSATRGAEPWSLTELPPSLRGADQALLHTSFQECKAAYACGSLQDTNDN